ESATDGAVLDLAAPATDDTRVVLREYDDSAERPVLLFGMSSGAVLALEAPARGSAVSALALYEPPFSSATPAHRCPLTTSTA
ncbi:hypothetical protein AB0D54_31630, partial [Streptomyces xanthophaeus]